MTQTMTSFPSSSFSLVISLVLSVAATRKLLKNLNYIKFNKNKTSYINHKILKKKKKKKRQHTQHKDIKSYNFFLNFFILKYLYDSLIINTANYIFFKILVL